MMEPLHLFSVFHLNLAYSAIAESQRAEVIERCYWPILRMASDRCPIGVEASGYTLETIARLDPGWIEEFRGQLNAGRCELVGSGYAQVIGPLVPWRVNAANLRIGLETYESLLETRPVIGLIGEQAYSSGLASQYGQAGYQALIMEWENPASAHPEWKSEWRYRPQMARDSRGESIPILWSSAIAFQKFQRYAHGELSLDDLVGYLRDQAGPGRPLFCIYANDAEVFDFRPGRYETEPALAEEGEWVRISRLLDRLSTLDAFRFCCPSEGLEYLRRDAEPLCLESAEDPVPVKKQRKYNVTRWAVTGRDDLGINTACWRIYRSLVERGAEEEGWKELCYLWSSDFRTHITEERWEAFRALLTGAEERCSIPDSPEPPSDRISTPPEKIRCEEEGQFLTIDTQRTTVRLNRARGLAVESLWFGDESDEPIVGTLPHGFYQDVAYAADFFTGHLVLETPGQHKVTDLAPVIADVQYRTDRVEVTATISTPLGPVRKTLRVYADRPRLDLEYDLHWNEVPAGSLRLGHMTLNPKRFDPTRLDYRTHNGGEQAETFPFRGRPFDHGEAVSFLVSASRAVGVTEGTIEIGDDRTRLVVEIDKCAAAAIALVSFQLVDESYFCRLAFSLRELDDTSRAEKSAAAPPGRTIRFSVTPG